MAIVLELQIWNEKRNRWDLHGHNDYTNYWWRWTYADIDSASKGYGKVLRSRRICKQWTPVRCRIVRTINGKSVVMMIEKETDNDKENS